VAEATKLKRERDNLRDLVDEPSDTIKDYCEDTK